MLTNLAQPEWVTVGCDQPLSAHAVCVVPFAVNESLQGNNHNDASELYNQGLIVRHSSCILSNDTCFIFLWLTHKYKQALNKSFVRTDALFRKLNINDLNYFKFLFDTVSVRFPAIFSSDLNTYHTVYQLRQSNTFMEKPSIYQFTSHAVTNSLFKGFYITAGKTESKHRGTNIFRCYRSFISQLGICDKIADCPDTHRSDEAGCVWNTTDIQNRKHQTCSSLFVQAASGLCMKYSFAFTSKKVHTKEKTPRQHAVLSKVPRRESTKVLSSSVASRGTNTSLLICQEMGQFPCTIAEDICFDLTDLCSFRLIEIEIVPCKTGEHLQNCHNFQCNAKFKCPDSYCIPWAYVCNGKWDCPHGQDEREKCSAERLCMNMFKCKLASICVHVHDLCDAKDDCPLHDDEQLCSLHAYNCPSVCTCLLFAISCNNITAVNWHMSHKFPWHAIFVENCTSFIAKNILTSLKHVSILVITNNDLTSLCDLYLPLKHVVLIDVAHNKLHMLSKNCFQNLAFLKSIQVKSNNISEL